MSELISEGAYGCVYRPGIKCDGTIQKKSVLSKIQKKKARTENEPIIGEKIKTIPHYERYFAPAEDVCKAILTTISKTEIQKCSVLKKKDPQDEFVTVKVRYIGKDTLGANLMKHASVDPTRFYEHILDTHSYLASAIEELIKVRIVHHDLKLNNVMYSDTKHVPIIIDFGVSFQIDDLYNTETLKTIFFSHYEKYPPWCLEVMCISRVLEEEKWETKKLNASNLQTIVDRFFKTNPLCEGVSQTVLNKYRTKWKAYINQMDKKAGKTVLKMLLTHWNTWDMYSVNAMYFMLATASDPKLPKTYQEYLISQLFCLPSERHSPSKTMENIEKINPQ